MAHTLFSAVTEIRGQVVALGQVDQSQAQAIADLATKVDALTAKVDTLTQSTQLAVAGLTQLLLNVQAVIGSPEDQG
jgi:hypothetical protein